MGIWEPPANFIKVSSQIEDITVYAPAPKEIQKADEASTYTCPNCGASTRFNVSAGGVACEHCGFSSRPDSARVGTRAQEFEFTLDTLQKGLGKNRRTLTCGQCGAILSISPEALTATCPFCASNKVSLRDSVLDELQPKYLIPFKLQSGEIQARAREWLGKGWFHPEELSKQARINQFTGVYLPFWTFDSNITADWRAEVGYERQESYYDAGSKSWKTRTKIDWRWENGRIHLQIDDLLVKGSTKISNKIMQRILSFDLHALQEYSPDFLAGWNAQQYDINLSQAWEDGKSSMREAAKKECYQDIPTNHVRNFSMVADFSDETWRYILLPVYISAYKFDEEIFQIMINGQTGTIAGQKPVAWWKIWLAIAGMLLPGLGVGLVGLPLLLLNGIGIFPLILGGILFTAGAFFAVQLYKQATDSEAA